MKTYSIFLLAFALLWGQLGPVHAEKADRNKPMSIEADALRYDDVKQVSVFTGHVVLTKGTILIRGSQVEVRQDADGFQFGRIAGAAEQPAFFRQKREGQDEYIEGEGDLLIYDGRADTVTISGKAHLRRYRGAALADEISGAVIVYENLTDLFKVDGDSGASGNLHTGRVRATLTPKPDDAAPAPGGASRPTGGAR